MSLLRTSPVGIIAADQQNVVVSNIIATDKANFGSDTNASTYASSSYTPTSSGLLVMVAAMHQTASGASADISAITGSSITGFAKVASLAHSTTYMTHLWAGLSTGSAGAVTVNFGLTIGGMRAALIEFTNVNTATGTHGVVQSATHGGTAATQTVTLSAFASGLNAAIAVWGGGSADTRTPKAGWTEVRESLFVPTNNADFEVQFYAGNDPAAEAVSSTGANTYGAVAAEIAGT